MLKSCFTFIAGMALFASSAAPAASSLERIAQSFDHVRVTLQNEEDDLDSAVMILESDETTYDVQEDTSAYKPAPVEGERYLHEVDTASISHDMGGVYCQEFLDTLRAGTAVLPFEGDAQEAMASLNELVSVYCGLQDGIDYYEVKNAQGTFLELTDESMQIMNTAIQEADAAFIGYKAYLEEVLGSMDLNTSDKDLVDQINEYICAHYTFAITNSSAPAFISSRTGQCWHYSKLFADLCKSAGIDAVKVQTTEHAWDEVTLDGVVYTFDVTRNDAGDDWTAYSWM